MIKIVRISKYDEVKLPDTFQPAMLETNKGINEVAVHFGTNMDIIVCVAKLKKLSDDDLTRIRILTYGR